MTRGWVGAPNERAPFRFHGAVVGFVDRCLSKTRILAASNQHLAFFSGLSWPKICPGIIIIIRPVTMGTFFFHKKFEFQRYPRKDFCTAHYGRISSKKVSYFSKTPKKIIPGPILGQDRPEKNSAKCLFEAARFRVLDRHRATKPTTAP